MLPTFIILALGVIDVSRGFSYHEAVANSARDASRVAALKSQQATGDLACAGVAAGTASATAHIPKSGGSQPAGDSPLLAMSGASGSPIMQSVALESSTDGTVAGTRIDGSTVTITWNCSGGKAITNASASSVDPNAGNASATIEIKVAYPFTFITPMANQIAPPTLTSDIYVRAGY